MPPAASFASLPGRQVLTLNMDVPESWLVEAVDAEVRRGSGRTFPFMLCGSHWQC